MEYKTIDIYTTLFWKTFSLRLEEFYNRKRNFSVNAIPEFLDTLGLCYVGCISNTTYKFLVTNDQLLFLAKIKYGI